MKKVLLIIASLSLSYVMQAGAGVSTSVSKTVNLTVAGTLSDSLTTKDDTTVTNLTVTGTINSTDFGTMSLMKALKVLDLSATNCTSIPDLTFFGCSGLVSINIPASVTSIGVDAFIGCSSLTTINIPASVTSIGNEAFSGCSGLTSISIPASVTSIGESAFGGCSSLLITVVSNNQKYSSVNGALLTKIQDTLIYVPRSATSFTIPTSVTSIGDYAFSGCTGLTSISIPTSVTFIDCDAFAYCRGLTSISILDSYPLIGNYVFYDCSNLTSIYAYAIMPIDLSYTKEDFEGIDTSTCTLYVPAGSKAAYQAAVQWKSFNHIQEFTPSEISTITDNTISLYPNPATTSFTVNTTAATVQLYTTHGVLVSSTKVTGGQPILVSQLPKGVYVVKIITDAGVTIKSLLVQ